MTVCDLTHAYHETSGGIRTYLDAKRRYILEQTDHTHALIVPAETDRIRREGRALTIEIGAPHIPGAAPYRWFANPRKVREALAYAAPEVIELGTYFMPTEWQPAFAVRKARRKANKPSIVSICTHTDFADSYAEGYGAKVFGQTVGKGIGRAAWGYVKRLIRATDCAAAPSPAQAAEFQRRGLDVALASYGVDTQTFAPEAASAAVREELAIPEGALFLVYAGRLDSEKRTDTMVAAVRRVNDTRPAVLVMVGEGPHRDRLAAEQAEGAPIRVLPYLTSKSALARLLASADLYLTAGPYETFGLSVAEAQACGLPVVGVQAGALIERVPEGLGLLGPVDDDRAMATHILEVAEHRHAMGQAARAKVVEQYSWDATFRAMFGLYEQSLASTS
ncbi:MAG TPA: glycosyltransferase [Bacteroidetes bacterium]|nr:glycosyltransferase [Bacteroidota bacterium]HIL58248.1 glycosyltransferase [Rhodothermales bacterium]